MAVYKNIEITFQFLDENPKSYVIFGDTLQKDGKCEVAKLRTHPHSIGFITKKFADNDETSFYRPEEYSPVFFEELKKLKTLVQRNPSKTFYITKLGSGLANRYRIWELLIHHNLVLALENFDNVVFCWEEDMNK